MEIIFPVLVFRTAPSVEGFLGPPPCLLIGNILSVILLPLSMNISILEY